MKASRRRTSTHPSRARRAALLLIAGLLLAAPGPLLGQSVPFEELTPEGVLVYVGVRDVPDLLERIKASPRFGLFSEPQMQPFLDQLSGSLTESQGELARALGRDPKELQGMLGGQAGFAVLPRGDRDAHFLLLADVSGNMAVAEQMLHNLLDYVTENENRYTVRREEFRGHTIHVVQPPEDEAAEAAEEGPAWDQEWPAEPRRRPWAARRQENPGFFVLSNGILAIASSPDRSLLEKHLVLREGGDLPSVAGSERYKRLERWLGEDRDVTVFADLAGAAQAEGPGLEGALSSGGAEALGLGVSLREDGLAAQGLMLAPSPRTGIMRSFEPGGADVLPLPYVDEDAALFCGLRFSLPVFWQELKAIIRRQAPEQLALMEQQFQLMEVDLEKDVIGAFGDRWFVYAPAIGLGEETPAELPMALVADLQRSEAFATALRQMLASLPPFVAVQTVDFMGVTVYQFAPQTAWEGEPTAVPQPCLAVMQDKMVYASSVEVAKAVIRDDRRETSPLRRSQGFQRLVGQTMDDPDGMLLVNGRSLGRWMIARMEQYRSEAHEMLEGLEPPPGMEPPDAEDVLPPELPSWDVLRKYETDLMATVKWTDDGLLLKTWTPDPVLEE